jgi:hypothetical protein
VTTEFQHTYAAWAEAFAIFAKYNSDFHQISAEHDIVYAGPEPSKVSDEDKSRLEQLNWHIDEHLDSFYHHV